MASTKPTTCAYTTLITRASYLPGVVLLAHSLRKHGSKFPLIVLYTDGLTPDAVSALEREAEINDFVLCKVDPLQPSAEYPLLAARFEDTWTKLRVFGSALWNYRKVTYLDADMLFLKNMDEVFNAAKLPGPFWLAASHNCCCNCDEDDWAPESWTKETCALSVPQNPVPVPRRGTLKHSHTLLNSGMFVFEPSERLWDNLMEFFRKSKNFHRYQFPDQDFLTEFFEDRWIPLGWQYNAFKTLRYWHPELWKDDEVTCLHYILDKPWANPVVSGVAGYKRMDGTTHQWWWDEFEKWQKERRYETELLEVVTQNMTGLLGDDWRAIGGESDDNRCMEKARSPTLSNSSPGSVRSSNSSDSFSSTIRSETTGVPGSVLRDRLLPRSLRPL